MRRRQLFEFLDQPWCPAPIRDAATDYLQFTIAVNNPYRSIVPRLSHALRQSQTARIIDLCAGAGGPWPYLKPLLDETLPFALHVLLTDRFPHGSSRIDGLSGDRLVLLPVVVDARHVPLLGSGFRTLFAGFHHFPPAHARAILRDAVRQQHGIGVFEVTKRRWQALALITLSALLVFFVTPLIRPWRWSRLFWTYIVPVVPFVVWFDGIVSCLRTYTAAEMHEMARAVAPSAYMWESGVEQVAGSPVAVTYLIGYPASTIEAVRAVENNG